MKISDTELKRWLKILNPNIIITLWCKDRLKLNSKQLDIIIEYEKRSRK